METREQLHQRVQHEQQLKARLRLATTRLTEAEQERIWAIVAAHHAGLSIRQIAAATGLSRSRIHQLLQDNEAREIPTWLSRPVTQTPPPRTRPLRTHLARKPGCTPAWRRRLRCCAGASTGWNGWSKAHRSLSTCVPTRRTPPNTCGLIRRGSAESWHASPLTSTR